MTVHQLSVPNGNTFSMNATNSAWCHLGGNTFVVAYMQSSVPVTVFVQTVVHNGSSPPSIGTARSVRNTGASASQMLRLIPYGSDRVLLFYGLGTLLEVQPLTISGSTVTEGTISTVMSMSSAVFEQAHIYRLSDTLLRLWVRVGFSSWRYFDAMAVDTATGTVTSGSFTTPIGNQSNLALEVQSVPGGTNTLEHVSTFACRLVSATGTIVSNIAGESVLLPRLLSMVSSTRGIATNNTLTSYGAVNSGTIGALVAATSGTLSGTVLVALDSFHCMAFELDATPRARVARLTSDLVPEVSPASNAGISPTFGVTPNFYHALGTKLQPTLHVVDSNNILLWFTSSDRMSYKILTV